MKKVLLSLMALCLLLPALAQEVKLGQMRINVDVEDGIKPLTSVGGYDLYYYVYGLTTNNTVFTQNFTFAVTCYIANASSTAVENCYFRAGLTDKDGNLKEWISIEDWNTSIGVSTAVEVSPACIITTEDLVVGDRIYLYAQIGATEENGWVKIDEYYGDDAVPTYIEIAEVGDPVYTWNVMLVDDGLTTNVSEYYTGMSFTTTIEPVNFSNTVVDKCYFKIGLTDSDGNLVEWLSNELSYSNFEIYTVIKVSLSCTITSDLQAGYRIRAFYQPNDDSEDGWKWIEPYDTENGEVVLSENMIQNILYDSVSGLFYNILNETTEVEVTCEKEDGESIPYTQDKVTIPTSVSTAETTYTVVGIGYQAFNGCTNLTSVDLGSVTYIGEQAFSNCTSLSDIELLETLTEIGDYAFSGCSSLSGELTIPNSVVTLGASAFNGCSGLTSVVIGSGVTTIGASAFQFCSNLSSVTLGENVVSIGGTAFASTILEGELVIPNKVTTIGDWAFSGLSGLTSLTLGSSLATIGGSAFNSCDGLTDVTSFNTTPPTCGENVFESVETSAIPLYVPKGCSSAYSSTSPWSGFAEIYEMLEVGDKIFVDGLYYYVLEGKELEVTYGGEEWYPTPEYTGEITIPSSIEYDGITYTVTGIGEGAFSRCTLTAINIPETVTSIGYGAFYYATHLKSIDILDNVTTMGTCAFQYSYSLESVTFGIGSCLTEIPMCAFSCCSSLKEVIIPEGVVSTGDWAFERCSSLAKVSLPSTLASLGNRTFMACGLKEIEVAEGNEYYCAVDNVLFTKDMTILVQYPIGLEATTYEIPSGVTTIGDCSLEHGSNLTSVKIPASVTTIENYVFYDCTSLTSITVLCETAPTCGYDVFDGVDSSNVILYVPKGCSSTYSSTSPWSGFNIVEIAEVGEKVCIDGIYYIVGEGTLTVTYGGDSYENGTEEYTGEITIPGTIVYAGTQCTIEVGEYAFANCTGITSITVDSETPPTCAENAFTGLTTSYITLYVPYGCTSAYSAVSPWSGFNIVEIVAEIGDRIKVDGMYYNVIAETELEVTYGGAEWYPTPEYTGEITIPETVTYHGTTFTVTGIGEGAFSYCALTAVNIPETVTSIGYSAFYEAYLLNSVDIPNSVTEMDTWAFGECYFLISVTLGSGLTEIPEGTFYSCYVLKEVDMTNNVTFIGDYAFSECFVLEQLTLGSNVTSIEYWAFGDAGYEVENGLALTVLNPTPPTLGYVFGDGHTNVYVPAGTLAEYNRVWGTPSGVSSMNELDYAVLKITLSDDGANGYATYYDDDYDIDLTDTGIKAYWAETVEEGTVTLTNIGTTIPAKTAVVLKGALTDLAEAKATALEAESTYTTNLLHGHSTTGMLEEEAGDYLYYMLTTNTSGTNVGFYYGATGGVAFSSKANKAWLAVPAGQSNSLSIKFKEDIDDEDDTTGISSMGANYGEGDGNIYTIQGIRVNDMNRSGVYVVNGKKILVK